MMMMTLCLRRYLSPLSVIEDSRTLARLTCVTNITTVPIMFAIVILDKHPRGMKLQQQSDLNVSTTHPGDSSQSFHKGVARVNPLKSHVKAGPKMSDNMIC